MGWLVYRRVQRIKRANNILHANQHGFRSQNAQDHLHMHVVHQLQHHPTTFFYFPRRYARSRKNPCIFNYIYNNKYQEHVSALPGLPTPQPIATD